MDIIAECREAITRKVEELKEYIEAQHDGQDYGGAQRQQTQSIINAAVVDKDKNLDKILDQQASIKTIIETDNVIRSLRRNIDQDKKAIDNLRKSVAKLGLDAMKTRSELSETHAKDVSCPSDYFLPPNYLIDY